MIVEMRTYTLKPGNIPTFEERFASALNIREKFSKLAAFWHTEVGPLNQVIHVWPYDSLDQREKCRAAMQADPDWKKYLEKSRPLMESQENRIMKAAPFFVERLKKMVADRDAWEVRI